MQKEASMDADNIFQEDCSPRKSVVICVRVVSDARLRLVGEQEERQEPELAGYVILSRVEGREQYLVPICSKEPSRQKNLAQLAAHTLHQHTHLAIEPARFVFDSKLLRSSKEITGLSFWECIYFVDISEFERDQMLSSRSSATGYRPYFVTPQEMVKLLRIASRGCFLRLGLTHHFQHQQSKAA